MRHSVICESYTSQEKAQLPVYTDGKLWELGAVALRVCFSSLCFLPRPTLTASSHGASGPWSKQWRIFVYVSLRQEADEILVYCYISPMASPPSCRLVRLCQVVGWESARVRGYESNLQGSQRVRWHFQTSIAFLPGKTSVTCGRLGVRLPC
jgi:hypothetical protein